MSSLVRELQTDITRGVKSSTEILRTAKLIAAKLELSDISEWLDCELKGYKESTTIPDYRIVRCGNLQLLNPYRGWIPGGSLRDVSLPIGQSIPELEQLAKAKQIVLHPPDHIPVNSLDGVSDGIINSFEQQIVIPKTNVLGIIEAVRDRLLDWTIELERRGIVGENMAFGVEEQASAKGQVFNIQHFTGVFGNVSHSSVQIYDYSTVHQMLRQQGVPQAERNELENIMDELKAADATKKKSVLEKAKAWVVKNTEFLGAGVDLVRRALGLE